MNAPLYDAEAEKAVLSEVLLYGFKRDIFLDRPPFAELFSTPRNTIMQAALDLYAEGGNIDLVTISNKLQRDGQYERVGLY